MRKNNLLTLPRSNSKCHYPNNQQTIKNQLQKLLKRYRRSPMTDEVLNRIKMDINKYLVSNQYRNSEIIKINLPSPQKHHHISFMIKHPYRYQFILKNNQHIETMHLLQTMRTQFFILSI